MRHEGTNFDVRNNSNVAQSFVSTVGSIGPYRPERCNPIALYASHKSPISYLWWYLDKLKSIVVVSAQSSSKARKSYMEEVLVKPNLGYSTMWQVRPSLVSRARGFDVKCYVRALRPRDV